jgi:hypothetical protein
VDADGDGFATGPQDCNDADPRVNVGARDIPGNAIDEDCKGGAAPFPPIGAGVSFTFLGFGGQRVRFTSFKVTKLPAGTRVLVTCKPPKRARRACPFRRFTRSFNRASAATSLLKRFKRRKLPKGTVVEIRETAAETIGAVTRLKVAGGTIRRTNLCLAPGAARPGRCT